MKIETKFDKGETIYAKKYILGKWVWFKGIIENIHISLYDGNLSIDYYIFFKGIGEESDDVESFMEKGSYKTEAEAQAECDRLDKEAGK